MEVRLASYVSSEWVLSKSGESKCSAIGMSDSIEGSLHYFPLRDGPQAKDISHPYSMKS